MMTQHSYSTAPWRAMNALSGTDATRALDELDALSLPNLMSVAARAGDAQHLDLPAVPAPASALQTDSCALLLDSLEIQYADWFDDFAPAEVDLSAWNSLAELAKRAPHPFLSGLACGKLAERLSICAITGRRPDDFDGSFRPDFLPADVVAQLEADHPEWFDACARMEADLGAPADEVKALVNIAPHPFLAGALYGRLTARLEFRAITGR